MWSVKIIVLRVPINDLVNYIVVPIAKAWGRYKSKRRTSEYCPIEGSDSDASDAVGKAVRRFFYYLFSEHSFKNNIVMLAQKVSS